MVTLGQDIDSIRLILRETFDIEPFKRDYDVAFSRVARILSRYDLEGNPRNLRFRFILCMQDFFDSIPQEQWRVKDPAFIRSSEDFAINRFCEWVIEQVT